MNDKQVRKAAVRKWQNQEEQVFFELEEELGREPTDDELWARLEDNIEADIDDYADQKFEEMREERAGL